MRRFGLAGYPVRHSLSPELFREAYDGKYPYDLIETSDFDEAWERFLDGYEAINVTMPFKTLAADRAAMLAEQAGKPYLIGPEVRATGAANILVKTPEGIVARNSDYLGVRKILSRIMDDWDSPAEVKIAVIGTGGAGRAAEAAAFDCGAVVSTYHHNEISQGVRADIIIYTLPENVEGTDRLECRYLLEANYKNPCLTGHRNYIPGTEWLKAQAECGYELMTGEFAKSK